MKNKNIIIISTVIVAVLVLGVLISIKSPIISDWLGDTKSVRRVTPRIVTMNFFNQWLTELKSTSTTPYDSGLLQSDALSDEVRAQIERAHANRKKNDIDPVLCLPRIPNKIDGEDIYLKNNKALVVVKPRDKKITTEHQAIVSLTLVDNRWLITKLDCTEGERPQEKEFDFEKVGSLLKQSIQSPYNKDKWHLVYEQETETGFVVPLTFNSESVCINLNGSTFVCDTSKLTETTEVFIQAGMTETGAVVKQMTFQ